MEGGITLAITGGLCASHPFNYGSAWIGCPKGGILLPPKSPFRRHSKLHLPPGHVMLPCVLGPAGQLGVTILQGQLTCRISRRMLGYFYTSGPVGTYVAPRWSVWVPHGTPLPDWLQRYMCINLTLRREQLPRLILLRNEVLDRVTRQALKISRDGSWAWREFRKDGGAWR